jgi:hypothetical protein
VLWGLWLVVLVLFFSEGAYLNSYYLAAIAPATAALCGTGVALATEHWEQPRARALLALAVLTSVAYGIHLLAPVAGALGVLAVLLAVRARLPWRGVSSLPLVLACGLLLPAAASLQIVTRDQGPFNAPYEPAHPTVSAQLAYRAGALPVGGPGVQVPRAGRARHLLLDARGSLHPGERPGDPPSRGVPRRDPLPGTPRTPTRHHDGPSADISIAPLTAQQRPAHPVAPRTLPALHPPPATRPNSARALPLPPPTTDCNPESAHTSSETATPSIKRNDRSYTNAKLRHRSGSTSRGSIGNRVEVDKP